MGGRPSSPLRVVVKVVFFFSSRKINHNVSVQRNPTSIEGAVDAPREMCFRFVALLSSKHHRASFLGVTFRGEREGIAASSGVCGAHREKSDEKTLEQNDCVRAKNASWVLSNSSRCHLSRARYRVPKSRRCSLVHISRAKSVRTLAWCDVVVRTKNEG